MPLTVLIGGARAGKSALATHLATQTGLRVTFVATAQALDEEMKRRIARHREERPSEWDTIEEPLDLHEALAKIDPDRAVVVDCLTLWVSNLVLGDFDDDEIEKRAAVAAQIVADREAPAFVVTNEVGSGVHPSTEVGRRFRDLLGRVNVIWSTAATEAFLVVAGRSIPLSPPELR
ncbi:MAG: bifunctional adenosylcobinamide kinase/adenosylcobinamide-phosphate guanylyltransferase [Actinomycetota bacterium]